MTNFKENREKLIKRLKSLADKPPPTLEKARQQWKSAAEYRRKCK